MTDYYNADNVYCCTYQEEISGYMAGYAAVKLGYKHLGFLGGMSVPAVTVLDMDMFRRRRSSQRAWNHK